MYIDLCDSCRHGTGQDTAASIYWGGRAWCQECYDGFREANPDEARRIDAEKERRDLVDRCSIQIKADFDHDIQFVCRSERAADRLKSELDACVEINVIQ